jgi:hypothetical protein
MIVEAEVLVRAPRGFRLAPRVHRYRLIDLRNGEAVERGADDVLRVVGVEIRLVEWAIAIDGAFENGRWPVEAGKLE